MRDHLCYRDFFGPADAIRANAWRGRREYGEHEFLEIVLITAGTAHHRRTGDGRQVMGDDR